MRVCPKCGHKDLPIWRNSRFYFNVDHASLDDLKSWGEEQIVQNLENDNYYEDGHFSYLLQPSGYVLRKETSLLNKDTEGEWARAKKERWFLINIEKRRKRKEENLHQKKLFEGSN